MQPLPRLAETFSQTCLIGNLRSLNMQSRAVHLIWGMLVQSNFRFIQACPGADAARVAAAVSKCQQGWFEGGCFQAAECRIIGCTSGIVRCSAAPRSHCSCRLSIALHFRRMPPYCFYLFVSMMAKFENVPFTALQSSVGNSLMQSMPG